MNNTDLLARARMHVKQAKGQNPFHSLLLPSTILTSVKRSWPTCDICNLQMGDKIALVGLSWRSGWLHVCDVCAQGECVSSADWKIMNVGPRISLHPSKSPKGIHII